MVEVREGRLDRCQLLPVETLGGDDHAGFADPEPRGDRLGSEGAEERRGHRAVLQGAEDGDVELRDRAEEREDAVAAADPERGDRVGEAVGLAREVGIAQVARAVRAMTPNRQLVASPREVAVDRFVRDVDPAPGEAVEVVARVRPPERRAGARVVFQVVRPTAQLDDAVHRPGRCSRCARPRHPGPFARGEMAARRRCDCAISGLIRRARRRGRRPPRGPHRRR